MLFFSIIISKTIEIKKVIIVTVIISLVLALCFLSIRIGINTSISIRSRINIFNARHLCIVNMSFLVNLCTLNPEP